MSTTSWVAVTLAAFVALSVVLTLEKPSLRERERWPWWLVTAVLLASVASDIASGESLGFDFLFTAVAFVVSLRTVLDPRWVRGEP